MLVSLIPNFHWTRCNHRSLEWFNKCKWVWPGRSGWTNLNNVLWSGYFWLQLENFQNCGISSSRFLLLVKSCRAKCIQIHRLLLSDKLFLFQTKKVQEKTHDPSRNSLISSQKKVIRSSCIFLTRWFWRHFFNVAWVRKCAAGSTIWYFPVFIH